MNGEDMEEIAGAPLKYVPLREVYDATAPPSHKDKICDSDHSKEQSELRKSKRRRVKSAKIIELENNSHVAVASPSDRNKISSDDKKDVGDAKCKQWTRLRIDADYKRFIGLKCKVHWPLDDDWYYGHVVGYDPVTDRHHIKYKDGDEEHLILLNERISFYVSPEEMQQLQLSYGVSCSDTNNCDIDEIISLDSTLDDCCDLDPSPGDMIWAKVTGHSTWPAVVLDESASSNLKGLNKISGEKSFWFSSFVPMILLSLARNKSSHFLEDFFLISI